MRLLKGPRNQSLGIRATVVVVQVLGKYVVDRYLDP